MITHWFSLLAGLALGLLPPRLLINCECRYLSFDDLWSKVILRKGDDSRRRRRWWKLPLVWIDPIRGYVTAWYLRTAFSPAMDSTSADRLMIVGISGVLMLVALGVQSAGRHNNRESFSPSGFVAGMMVQILPPMVAAAALVMGVAAAIAFQTYAAGYVIATMTLVGVGYVFMGKSFTLATAVAIMSFPLVFSWFRRDTMVMPVRF